jgi:gluconolactonase
VLDFSGVFRLAPGGRPTPLPREMRAPNGLALSFPERTLTVSNADPARAVWLAYDAREDGTLGSGRAGGVQVFTPDGAHLGSIEMPVPTSNVTWGNDGTALSMTADTVISRIRLTTKGAGF